ncbi:MAG: glycosyltransferase family A protein [Dehalococcoidia bacterium]|nr:glycosyltransferase family A protein [Dehalococcoidia bacterium]
MASIRRALVRRRPPNVAPQPARRKVGAAPFLDDIKPSMYEIVATGGPSDTAPQVSVVVPTRNRRDLLSDTIGALLAQDMPPGSYEILVVDNASTDGTTELLQAAAMSSPVPFTGIRAKRNRGPAVSRNTGVQNARGKIVAFTDSDCVPTHSWLRSMLTAFAAGVGVAQGRTTAHPAQGQPLFNHFIETLDFDGSYSTSNVAYLKEAVVEAGGFDPGCSYWEDVDLGWRVYRLGWEAVFAPEALVYHQVLRLSAPGWLLNAWHYHIWPAKAARYPEFGRYLFCRLWSHPLHPLFQAFVLGLTLGAWRRPFLLLTLPYLFFPFRQRLVGRWPPLRAGAHVARDAVALAALLTGSVRFRRLVL